jgi:hypothetical protein
MLSLVTLVVYRLFFHPLASFPGPWMNAISSVSQRFVLSLKGPSKAEQSKLPVIYSLLKGRLAMKHKLLHDKYGGIWSAPCKGFWKG